MIDKAWLQQVKDGRGVIGRLDKDIWQIADIEDRDILIRLFKDAREDFHLSTDLGSDKLPDRYGRLLEISALVNELLNR